jgi:hypothetical protein
VNPDKIKDVTDRLRKEALVMRGMGMAGIDSKRSLLVEEAADLISDLLELYGALMESSNERELALNDLLKEARKVASQRQVEIDRLKCTLADICRKKAT